MPKSNDKKIEFSIVIPNYNGEKLLQKNLPNVIEASKLKRNKIKEIIIVDDHSQDDSVKIIQDKFPEVDLIKHTKNRGFSAAVNTGARTSSANFIVLLNTDVIPDREFLVPVIKHFKEDNVFAVSLHERGYGWAKGDFKEGFLIHEPGIESEKPHDSFWASGGSAVFRRKMWMKLKGMDQELFSPFYWEDVDLSYRAQKRGWHILWEPEARVEHEHESTTSKINKNFRNKIQERNQLIFNWKNITSKSLMRRHVRGLVKRSLRHPGYLRIIWMALGKLSVVLQKRKIEIKESSVSDEAILARF